MESLRPPEGLCALRFGRCGSVNASPSVFTVVYCVRRIPEHVLLSVAGDAVLSFPMR